MLPERLVGLDGRVIWDRTRSALPDPATFVREIRSADGAIDLSLLRQCVNVVLVYATPQSLPTWCSWLLCLADPTSTLRALRERSAGSRVCGYVFKRGDIAWNCRKCQVDATCVQCDRCYRQSDHRGHPVYFHRTAPGGCCDCGDEEAWADEGCCPRHRKPSGGRGATNPLDALPEDLRAVARVVVRCVLLFLEGVAWSSLDTFDPDLSVFSAPTRSPDRDTRGDSTGGARPPGDSVGDVAPPRSSSWSAGGGRGNGGRGAGGGTRMGRRSNRGLWGSDGECSEDGGDQQQEHRKAREKAEVVVRVHNDDVHTFDFVIKTFMEIDISYDLAERLTHQVDQHGMAEVLRVPRAKARHQVQFLRARGLMAALCDKSFIAAENRALSLLSWLNSICSQTEGLRRIVAQELVGSHGPAPPSNPTSVSSSSKSSPSSVSGGDISSLSGSSSTSTATTSSEGGLSPTGSSGGRDVDGNRVGARRGIAGRVASNNGGRGTPSYPAPAAASEAADSVLFSQLPRFSARFGIDVDVGHLWVHETWNRGPTSVDGPYPASRNVPLGILVASDPLVARPLRLALHGLLMSLLVDQEFKRDFAIVFARLYEYLNTLFCKGVGVSQESIFSFSVQTFTTPSLVRLLADTTARAPSTLLPNPDRAEVPGVWCSSETPGLIALLAKALVRTICDAGCRDGCGWGPSGEEERMPPERNRGQGSWHYENLFLDHEIVVYQRYGHVFRDMEYALQSPGTALDVATGTVNPGPGSEPLRLWLKVLTALQYMDAAIRRVGSHVEYESRRFNGALSLTFALAGVTDALVERALRKAPSMPTTATAPGSNSFGGPDGDAESHATSDPSVGLGAIAASGPEGWANESRRVEAGEVLARKSLAALKAWAEEREGQSVYRLAPMSHVPHMPFVYLRHRVAFRVHRDPVSIHLPLHRFFAKVVLTIAQEGMPIPHVPEDACLPLVEFPLRAVVFYAQVMARLWVRNGISAHSQATNYAVPPLCRHMRDLDLIALQLSCLSIGADNFLALLLDKFQLQEWLLDPMMKPSRYYAEGDGAIRSSSSSSSSSSSPSQTQHGFSLFSLSSMAAGSEHLGLPPWIAMPASARVSSQRHEAENVQGSPQTTRLRALQQANQTMSASAAGGSSTGSSAIGSGVVPQAGGGIPSVPGSLQMPPQLPAVPPVPPVGPLPTGESLGSASSTVSQSPSSRSELASKEEGDIFAGAKLLLAEECLSFIVALLTELPRPPGRASAKAALRREVVHRLASLECTHSEVSAVVGNVMEPDPEEFLDDVLAEVGEVRDANKRLLPSAPPSSKQGSPAGVGGGSGGAIKYSLSSPSTGEYDPTFIRLNRTEHQAAVETVARKRAASRASAGGSSATKGVSRKGRNVEPRPLVGPPPGAHRTFLPVRLGLLYSAVVIRGVRVIVRDYAEKKPNRYSELLLSRALQIITLQLHGLAPPPLSSSASGDERMDVDEDKGEGGGVGEDGRRSAGVAGGVGAAAGTGGHSEHDPTLVDNEAYFAAVLESSAPSAVGGASEGGANVGKGKSLPEERREGADAGDGARAVAGGEAARGDSMCELIGKVAREHGVLDALYEDGLQWIVEEFARRSPACRRILGEMGVIPEVEGGKADGDAGRGVGGGGSSGVGGQGAHKAGNRGMSIADKMKKAKEAAMEAMIKKQKEFALHAGLGDLKDEYSDEEDEEETAAGKGKPSLHQVSLLEEGCPECIMCHERSGRPIGYIGLAQRSPMLATGVAGNPHRRLLRRQMIVGKYPCQKDLRCGLLYSWPMAQVRRGIDVSSEKVTTLRSGTNYEVLISQRVGRRVRCVAPAVGWASVRDSDGAEILEPLERKAFNKWGRERLHVSLCGHAVHFGCWDAYFASLMGRAMANQTFDGRLAVDVHRTEFTCPMCKSLSNTLIAHIPPSAHASAIVNNPAAVAANSVRSSSSLGAGGGNSGGVLPEAGKRDTCCTSPTAAVTERSLVERLASADGLAEWVLLQEHGGAGADTLPASSPSPGSCAAGGVPMEVDDEERELKPGRAAGAEGKGAAEGGDTNSAAATSAPAKKRNRKLSLKFGGPRSGLGQALVGGVVPYRWCLEGSDAVAQAVASVITDSPLEKLAESLEKASCPPWANSDSEASGLHRQQQSRMRILFKLWASVGYTAAASETASRNEPCFGGVGISHGDDVFRANETLYLRRLLRVVEHGTALLEDIKGRGAMGDSDGSVGFGENDADSRDSSGSGAAGAVEVGSWAGRASASAATDNGEGSDASDAVSGSPRSSDSSEAKLSPSRSEMETKSGLIGVDGSGAHGGDPSRGLPKSQGVVAALKLARIVAGADVLPSVEGLKRGTSSGTFVGRQMLLSRAESAWLRRGLQLPLQTVQDPNTLSEADRKRIDAFQKKQGSVLVRASAFARKYFAVYGAVETGGSREACPPTSKKLLPGVASALESVWECDKLWPVMQTPLLAWDMNTLLVATVSMARTWSSRAGAMRAVCLGRLCQALLQPEMCLRGSGTVTGPGPRGQKRRQQSTPGKLSMASENKDEGRCVDHVLESTASALEYLRSVLAETTGTPVSPVAPVGEDLVMLCYSSWLPFLRCAAFIMIASCSTSNATDDENAIGGRDLRGDEEEERWRENIVDAYMGTLELTQAAVKAAKSAGTTAGTKTKVSEASMASAASKPAEASAVAGARAQLTAVQSMCLALGVPLPQAVTASGIAMTLVRRWGVQYGGAYGPADSRAAVCRIGTETLSPSTVEAYLGRPGTTGISGTDEASTEGMLPRSAGRSTHRWRNFGGGGNNPGDAPSGGSGDDVSTSPIAQGDFFLDPGDDDAAADGVDSLSDTAADAVAGAAANISMVYGGGAEENADAGAGAAEEMGFDVLDMGDDGDGWMNIQPTGVGAPSAAVGAVAGFVGSHAGVGDVGGGGQAQAPVAMEDDSAEQKEEDEPVEEHKGEEGLDWEADEDDVTEYGSASATQMTLGEEDGHLAQSQESQANGGGLEGNEGGGNRASSASGRGARIVYHGRARLADDTLQRRRPVFSGASGAVPQVLTPHLGSLTAGLTTPDVTGKPLKGVLFDISHMGLSCQDNLDLVDLPESFTELYGRAKSPHAFAAAAEAGARVAGLETDPAVCLVCGQVLAAGWKAPAMMSSGHQGVGECTLHARYCGGGVGVFFLVQRCVVLLIRDSRGAYYPSIYLDDHGEEDAGLKRGRPLFLNQHRYQALKQLYLRHRIVQEVSTIRANSDRVIRENYY